MNRISLWKIILTLVVFSPLAFLPTASRAALLTSRPCSVSQDREMIKNLAVDSLTRDGISREHAEKVIDNLSYSEVEVIALSQSGFLIGGKDVGVKGALESNETVAIVLTIIMLAVIVGFVEISRH
jgi:hypothetical protein